MATRKDVNDYLADKKKQNPAFKARLGRIEKLAKEKAKKIMEEKKMKKMKKVTYGSDEEKQKKPLLKSVLSLRDQAIFFAFLAIEKRLCLGEEAECYLSDGRGLRVKK